MLLAKMKRAVRVKGNVAVLAMAVFLVCQRSEGKAGDTNAASREVEWDELRPGLTASYRSLVDPEAMLARVEAKPAFTLGRSSPHPRLPPGPFEVEWAGVLWCKDSAPVKFGAYICGELTVEVDGVAVLHGRGDRETARVEAKQPLDRKPGLYPLRIRYRSLEGRPARLQIGWQAAAFAREPLPAWVLKHVPADLPKAVMQDLLAAKGRLAVGRLGCARCHRTAFPGVTEPPPGPSLADAGQRLRRGWLMEWLADPAKVRSEARMPALFPPGRKGFVERGLVADYLLGQAPVADSKPAEGDHRHGRQSFIRLGCAACHFLPDGARAEQPDLGRTPLTGLGDRLPGPALAAFLGNPRSRYPDGRMPHVPVAPETARDIAAYLLMWSKAAAPPPNAEPPTAAEINDMATSLKVNGRETAAALVRARGCAQCHTGLGDNEPKDIPLVVADDTRGCFAAKGLPHFAVDPETRKVIAAYRRVAAREKHPSAFEARRRLLKRSGCVQCHQRDSDRPPPVEEIGSTLGGAWLESVPYQRTPRLTDVLQKYRSTHVLSAVRDGVTGLRGELYTYRMPAFGEQAEALVQALAESDGELPGQGEPAAGSRADPTLGPLVGSSLVGFQGYACVSCHVWNGRLLSSPDPGAIGPDLTRVAGRIRRDWFDRFLEDPARFHPGTPMPAIFPRGKPALLPSVLGGDPVRQKEALWSYFALGKEAPNPKPPPPLPVTAPAPGEGPIVAQIPIRLPNNDLVESISILYGTHDLLIYDLAGPGLRGVYTGAEILRNVQGRLRTFTAAGTLIAGDLKADPVLRLLGGAKPQTAADLELQGYDRLQDGVRIRWLARTSAATLALAETLRLVPEGSKRRLLRELRVSGMPSGWSVEWRTRVPASMPTVMLPGGDAVKSSRVDGVQTTVLGPVPDGRSVAAVLSYTLPPAQAAPARGRTVLADPGIAEGALERPGYRAIAYPRPKTISGEDRIMPTAVAVSPRTGKVFVASMKTGELFALHDPAGDGKSARFDNYARGLFQEALSMYAEGDNLYVLHRRNLTRITDTDGDGKADRFDRVAALPHGVAETYDYAYGLAQDRTGGFILSYAPYANGKMAGSGSAVRLLPGRPPQEVAFGFRNPLGWCAGPEGEIFFTDNQGEWVATNKLCHLAEGRYYGFPNHAQPQHLSKPRGRTAVWVPYGWARSINGVAYDNTGGKFGPFAGQFFLAELMFGGAIIRADVEKVNGEYQGICFPFWGKGLLGPLSLAFDPKGRLFVGGITEPGWMAQPDRGALFRIDFTGRTPFEMQTIRVRPRGFRIVFTTPVNQATASDPATYQVEHYRYEYTGAYGSPELDRTRVRVERVEVAPDGRSVELTLPPLVKDRVYLISPQGVRSAGGETLASPVGAYTVNEVPAARD